SVRVSALNSGEWIIRFFLFVMVHLVSDCTHLTQCPKLLVRISGKCQPYLGRYSVLKKSELNEIGFFPLDMTKSE
ncbi:hypothetical protein DMW02_10515, partial [Vibrio parahaemolyticus]|nr:hypothetical protein [Vibrio parahaemolyticus]EGR3074652.1 hypothetical protein [Vibrio parahaemolyticus]